jgi:hypothetical protein
MLRWNSQGRWRGWLAYTWSQTRDRIDGRNVVRSWDQTHAVSLGITWASGPWTATVTDNFHTGWPTTRLSLVTTATGEQDFVIGERNAQRMDYYNSLDLRLTRTFVLPRGAPDQHRVDPVAEQALRELRGIAVGADEVGGLHGRTGGGASFVTVRTRMHFGRQFRSRRHEIT